MLFRFTGGLLCTDYSPMSDFGHFNAAIFDLGGVFIDWNPRYLYRSLFPGDEEGMERFLSEVTTGPWNRQMDAGKPFAEAVAELQREHPDQAELIAAYWDRWPEMLGKVNLETAAIVRDLRSRGLRVFALERLVGPDVPARSPGSSRARVVRRHPDLGRSAHHQAGPPRVRTRCEALQRGSGHDAVR